MVTIIFESHGTTTDNEKHLVSGWADVGLSELGIKQSKEMGQRYATIVKFEDANEKLGWSKRGKVLLELAARKYKEYKHPGYAEKPEITKEQLLKMLGRD